MLPILCLMDIFGLWAYRKKWDRGNMKIILPAAIVGIGFGVATADHVGENHIRLIIGLIAVAFTLLYWTGQHGTRQPAGRSIVKGGFWGAVSGFTSFVSHAGGPPLSIYMLPQKLDKTLFVGTSVIFFAAVNYLKLIPYYFLDQLAAGNLLTSLALSPLAPLGMGLGIWLHGRVSPFVFYRACYVMVFLVGLKLMWDGASSFLSA